MFTLTRQDTAVMKGIAICAMLCHHLYGCLPDGVEPYSEFLYWLGGLGKVCVALFLFCSGYGLSANFKQQSILDDIKFVARRLVKFYANYWVIFVIFVPITYFVFGRTFSDAYGQVNIPKRFIYDILAIQVPPYNITWWFNKLIIVLYLLFPLLYRLVHMQPLIVAIVCALILRFSEYIHIPYDNIKICVWLFPFVLGILWKYYDERYPKIEARQEHKTLFPVSSIVLLLAVIALRMMPIIPQWTDVKIDGFLSCAIAMVVISTMRYMPYCSKVFAFLGKHSMNIYMTHTFFLSYWHPEWLSACGWMRGGGNFIVLMMICLIVSIGIEYLKEKIRLYELLNYIIKRI